MTFRKQKVRHVDMKIGAPASMQGKNGRLFFSITDGPDEEAGLRAVAGGGEQIAVEGNAGKLVDRLMVQHPLKELHLVG